MPEPDRIIRLKTVLFRTGLSRSTIYRKIAEGTFPAQLKISTNGAGWRESDINRWIADPVSWRPKGQFEAKTVRSAPNASTQVRTHGRHDSSVQLGSQMSRPEILTKTFDASDKSWISLRQKAK